MESNTLCITQEAIPTCRGSLLSPSLPSEQSNKSAASLRILQAPGRDLGFWTWP